jgi:hypothetical protein
MFRHESIDTNQFWGMVKEGGTGGKPSLETECEGGGSQTWVTPAAAMSSTFPIIMLYHPPPCFHDSQLNPCSKADSHGLTNLLSSESQILIPTELKYKDQIEMRT